MLKLFWLVACLYIVLTTFVAKASAGLTVPSQKTESSEVIKSKIDVPICYMQTANGTILDLSSLCKQSSNLRTRSTQPSPSPYNYSSIKKFDDELYGEGK